MNEVRKRHNERKIITEQHFCSKCGDRLASKYSPCGQCESELEQSKQKHRRIHVKGVNKSVLPQSSFSFLGRGLLPLVVVSFALGLITFSIIGMASAPDVIYIEPDFGDGGYYDDGYYDGGYYDDPLGITSFYGDGFYGPGNNVECIFEECVPYGTGGW